MRGQRPEAVRYYQAALAVRPDAPGVCYRLGMVLSEIGRPGEAVEALGRAVQLGPASVEYRVSLVRGLVAAGRTDEALEQARRAVRELPETARSHGIVGRSEFREVNGAARLRAALGSALAAAGRDADAVAEYQWATTREPALKEAFDPLREVLVRLGRLDELRAAWQAALADRLVRHEEHYGYAELCLFLGREDDYRAARRTLLEAFADYHVPGTAERTGRACLLLPASGEELLRAAALADRAAAPERRQAGAFFPYYQFVGGLADYRRGRFDRAINIMRGDAAGVLGPAPRLVLAMALHRAGRPGEARQALASAAVAHDWRANRVSDQNDWIYHVLRREAEALILPDLPAFVAGKRLPRDTDDRMCFLAACQFGDRPLTAARLYADIFAADPGVAADFRTGHRSTAACFAALVGLGRGADVTGVGELERARWRTQARQWLRADLLAWRGALRTDPAATRDALRARLTRWQADPDLAGLREPSELTQLPADERRDCLTLWAEVDELLKPPGGTSPKP